jgi:hypothetical protein
LNLKVVLSNGLVNRISLGISRWSQCATVVARVSHLVKIIVFFGVLFLCVDRVGAEAVGTAVKSGQVIVVKQVPLAF